LAAFTINIAESNFRHTHPEIFDLTGKKLFTVKGANVYRLSGELVGHLSTAAGSETRLDRSNDRLFPEPSIRPRWDGHARHC
jgi:hypothetical protein